MNSVTHLDKAGVDVDELHPAVPLDKLPQDGVHTTVPLSQGSIRAPAWQKGLKIV